MQNIISLPKLKTTWKLYVVLAIIIVLRYMNISSHLPHYQRMLIHTAISNTLIFLTAYCLARRLEMPSIWKSAVYVGVMTGLTWTNYNLLMWTWDKISMQYFGWLLYDISPYLFFILLTAAMMKFLFRFDIESAILLGILLGTMGVATMELALLYAPPTLPTPF